MSLGDTSANIAEAIAKSKKNFDQEWLADYIIGFLRSPSWVTPVMEYIDQHCIIFDSEDENKFEYTAKHNEFRALIDGLLAAHLVDVSISSEEFEEFLQEGLTNKSLHHILVEQLLSVDDFFTFKAMMVKKNKELQMQALQQLEKQQQHVVEQIAEQQAIQQLATEITKSVVIEAEPDLQDPDETLGEAEEVLSPTSGPGRAIDWSMYEDEDKLISEALRVSKEAAISSTQETEIRKEQEEADMKLAMALSLQVEEELQKRMQAQKEEDMPQDDHGASCSSAVCQAPQATAQVAKTIHEELAAPEAVSASAPDAAQVKVAVEADKPFSIAEMDALDNSRSRHEKKAAFSMPRMVTLAPVTPPVRAPMKNTTTASLYECGSSGPMPVKANMVDVVDLKATAPAAKPHAPTTTAPAPTKLTVSAASRVPTPQKPTAEEMRQRAEHLKKQRELLVQKKKQEREQKLHEFQKVGGQKRPDKVEVESTKKQDSQRLLSQLTAKAEPGAAPEVCSKEVDRATQMRQALTTMLKESLYQTLGTA
jgi:hypothetical protein